MKKNNIKLNFDVTTNTKNNKLMKFSENKILTKRIVKEKGLSIKVKKNDNNGEMRQNENTIVDNSISLSNDEIICKNGDEYTSIL